MGTLDHEHLAETTGGVLETIHQADVGQTFRITTEYGSVLATMREPVIHHEITDEDDGVFRAQFDILETKRAFRDSHEYCEIVAWAPPGAHKFRRPQLILGFHANGDDEIEAGGTVTHVDESNGPSPV